MTMDLWTAQHQQCFYILLTVHFVDNDFELKSRCLQTLEVPQDLNASSPYGGAGHSILKDWKNLRESVWRYHRQWKQHCQCHWSKGPVTKLLNDLFEQQSQSCSHSDKVEKELNLYKAEQPADLDSNSLAWWKELKSLYPLMTKLVQKVFSVVATFDHSGFSCYHQET